MIQFLEKNTLPETDFFRPLKVDSPGISEIPSLETNHFGGQTLSFSEGNISRDQP